MHPVDPDNPITTLGEAFVRRRPVRFGIKRADRRKPMFVMGKTGMGKSTLLANVVLADIHAGEGVVVLDPHGELVEETILPRVPERRVDDVIYVNAADTERPVPFNPLAATNPAYHHLEASGLISILKKIWGHSWGPQLEHILRHAVLTGLAWPGATLHFIPRLLLDADFRKRVVTGLPDSYLQHFWRQEFGAFSASFRSEAVAPILNKVGQFLASPLMRGICGQVENTVDLRQAMDTGKIVLVNLAKGRIGEDASALLGAMLITKLWLAALSRQEVPEERRRVVYLTVDEAHSFGTMTFADMLSETRKYGVNPILASQFLEQWEPPVRAAILGNIGTLMSFRTGAEDAEYLVREFFPVFKEDDLVNLPQYQMCLKLLIDGVPSRAFSAVTLPLQVAPTGTRERIIERSRQRYGRVPTEGRY